ncbi:MAG: ArgK/MeaB family GTPase [Acidimicrobiia bacterium]
MSGVGLDRIRSGDLRALSRAISVVEGGGSLPGLEPNSTPVIGVTGPPGAGKSTLISAMISQMREVGDTVGVLAVDPSSPVTGGAMLGDRIRMQGHIDDPGVYIRSMATRGSLGGLAPAAAEAIGLMGLAGFDRLLLETVGVGQSEVEVMKLADLVVLVVGPGWGDGVQADKAGVVEIADVFVVNKGDRAGADEVRRALAEVAGARQVELIITTATTGEGVGELISAIDRLLQR